MCSVIYGFGSCLLSRWSNDRSIGSGLPSFPLSPLIVATFDPTCLSSFFPFFLFFLFFFLFLLLSTPVSRENFKLFGWQEDRNFNFIFRRGIFKFNSKSANNCKLARRRNGRLRISSLLPAWRIAYWDFWSQSAKQKSAGKVGRWRISVPSDVNRIEGS